MALKHQKSNQIIRNITLSKQDRKKRTPSTIPFLIGHHKY